MPWGPRHERMIGPQMWCRDAANLMEDSSSALCRIGRVAGTETRFVRLFRSCSSGGGTRWEMPSRTLKTRARRLLWLSFASLGACAFTAEARPAPVMGSLAMAPEPAAASSQCPATQHFDATMSMCMPNSKTASPPTRAEPPNAGPAKAPSMTTSSPSGPAPHSTMDMPMPAGAESNNGVVVQLNQFMLYSHTSGPRGHSRLTGPGMWMLMYAQDLSPKNHFSVDLMGTAEQLTVGKKGTPQLLQTENVDAMHPHDYIMALEFKDRVTLDTQNNKQLTFLFAPRGEAAIGPVPFMHRESAEGNPDAPLGHALQDGFHDVSTVLGIEYQLDRTTIEGTVFSGKDIVWPLPLHRPDSFGVRVNQNIDNHLALGASYADALLPQDTGGAEHNRFISAWLSASYLLGSDTLKSSLIWGRGHAADHAPLNSFLEEAVFQHGPNKFYDRAEILQISPAQLEVVVPGGGAAPKWVEALTAGYERTLFETRGLSFLAGGSYTKDFIPAQFEHAYGPDQGGAKLYVRVTFNGRMY